MQTRETYIQAVRAAVIAAAIGSLDTSEARMLSGLKMVYGSGYGTGARGVTYFGVWTGGLAHGPDCGCASGSPVERQRPHESSDSLIELCAFAEESAVQLCGTTVHEMAHALAGRMAAHGKDWKAACVRLGLRTAKAAGTTYRVAMFAPRLRELLAAIPLPTDGKAIAAWGQAAPAVTGRGRPCSHGVGSRGGRSRGAGSGSRLRKWVCGCGVIARVASDNFEATCGKCGGAFARG